MKDGRLRRIFSRSAATIGCGIQMSPLCEPGRTNADTEDPRCRLVIAAGLSIGIGLAASLWFAKLTLCAPTPGVWDGQCGTKAPRSSGWAWKWRSSTASSLLPSTKTVMTFRSALKVGANSSMRCAMAIRHRVGMRGFAIDRGRERELFKPLLEPLHGLRFDHSADLRENPHQA